jgi:hypothetical protein
MNNPPAYGLPSAPTISTFITSGLLSATFKKIPSGKLVGKFTISF